MRRREFIATLGGAVAFPLAAQTERTRRIGALMAFTENDAEGRVRIAAFRRQLQELGWSDGRGEGVQVQRIAGVPEGAQEPSRCAAPTWECGLHAMPQ